MSFVSAASTSLGNNRSLRSSARRSSRLITGSLKKVYFFRKHIQTKMKKKAFISRSIGDGLSLSERVVVGIILMSVTIFSLVIVSYHL